MIFSSGRGTYVVAADTRSIQKSQQGSRARGKKQLPQETLLNGTGAQCETPEGDAKALGTPVFFARCYKILLMPLH